MHLPKVVVTDGAKVVGVVLGAGVIGTFGLVVLGGANVVGAMVVSGAGVVVVVGAGVNGALGVVVVCSVCK